MARAYLHTFYNGKWIPVPGGPTGRMSDNGGGDGLPSGQDTVTPWSYAAASGGITDTADNTLIAATGAGKANYLTSLQVMNSSATATEVVVKTGSTVLWRARFGVSMISPVSIEFKRPLQSANNTSLTVACITNATTTYVNAQGYSDGTVSAINAQLTSEEEIFDAAGALVTTDAGATIYLA